MSTTIARRIRRIGLLASTYKEHENGKGQKIVTRIHNFDPAITAEAKVGAAIVIRAEHYARREAAKKNPAPAKHRRSKSRKTTAKKPTP